MDSDKYERLKKKAIESKQRSFEKHKRKNQYFINDCLREVRYSNRYGSKINCFVYYPNNTDEHENTKFEVFKHLRKQGKDVLVEPIFENGSRADILCVSDAIIYEVLKSETEEMLQEKVKKYPEIFEIVKVKCGEFNPENYDFS